MNTLSAGISKTQLDSFFTDGYAVLPAAVRMSLLQKLRNLFDEEINDKESTRKVVNTANGKDYVSNIDHLFASKNLACLEVLGVPFILEVAEAICGPDFFLIQEFAVIKMLGDNAQVLWHQDMLHQRTGNCFTMGVYLDDADAGDGALIVVPRSHLSNKDICTLKQEPSVPVPVKAGDILIHDIMLAHASGLMHHNSIRRVIYFEFMSHTQAIKENIYVKEEIYQRMRLLSLVIEYYHQQNPGEKKFEWKNTLAVPVENPGSFYETLADIHRGKSLGRPSAYCFDNI